MATVIVCCAAAAPSKADKKDADPAAVAALKEAHDKRESFPANFGGVSAALTVADDTGEVHGTLQYSSGGELTIALTGATKEQEKWAKEQLGSAFSHRKADDFSKGDGAGPLTFGPDDHSPLGKQILLNDKFNSCYRVKDGHIVQVTRQMGPSMKFTITVTGDRNLPTGNYLPAQFTVTYFDASSGTIRKVDMFTDTFKKLGDAWVPSGRRVITAENGAFTTKAFKLEEIKAADTAGTVTK